MILPSLCNAVTAIRKHLLRAIFRGLSKQSRNMNLLPASREEGETQYEHARAATRWSDLPARTTSPSPPPTCLPTQSWVFCRNLVSPRLDFRRSLVSGLPSPRREFAGEERGLLSRAAAGNRAYVPPSQELSLEMSTLKRFISFNQIKRLKLAFNKFETVSLDNRYLSWPAKKICKFLFSYLSFTAIVRRSLTLKVLFIKLLIVPLSQPVASRGRLVLSFRRVD